LKVEILLIDVTDFEVCLCRTSKPILLLDTLALLKKRIFTKVKAFDTTGKYLCIFSQYCMTITIASKEVDYIFFLKRG
jgi:hypothetical protein